MAGYSPAAEAIELFLAGEIGVLQLGERLASSGVPPAQIAAELARFAAAGRLPERLAALLQERVLAGAAVSGQRRTAMDPRPGLPPVRPALPDRLAVPGEHALREPDRRNFDPPDFDPPHAQDPAAARRAPLPPRHDDRTLRPLAGPRRIARPLPQADREGDLDPRPVLGSRSRAPEAPRPFPSARDFQPNIVSREDVPEKSATQRPLSPRPMPPRPAPPVPLPLPSLPTRPGGRVPLAAAPEEGGDTQPRARVEQSITDALLSGLRGLRHKAPEPHGPGLNERHLDGWLSGFRSMRVRRQADRVTAGGRPEAKHLPTHAPKLGIGFMLKDRFVLDDELGHGGMGEVFRAVDRRRLEAGDPDPYVALKVLSAQFRLHPDALATLEAEAHKVQSLAHPNICPIYDFDRDGPHAFFVMELLQGETLDMALHRAPGLPLDGELAGHVTSGVLAAMSHAHARGIVHGDLKPGNAFLTREGVAKVLDFGVAVALRGGGFNPEGLAAYTPAFSSPEMIAGAPRDPRDDVFSLGCLIYLIYSGAHPYGRRPAGEAAQLGLVPDPIPGIPEASWAALEAALAFAREDRPADARALARALLPGLGGRRRED
ncbi:serine/threonine-protein kinase [Xanthobacter sp. DSM 24535]|uniref:serine/threonine-protein kinase n=1 Tax=Roseixanthobacter psychrophilus TaxID=3119917 RepID=UPI0037280886